MQLDLHGKNRYQARVAIAAALKRSTPADYRLRLIHGYQSGTALRQLVREEFAKDPRVLRVELSHNPGETILVLREY